MSDDKGYEFFEHTADVGMRAWGSTLAELFERSARGMTELIVEDSRVRPTESRAVSLQAESVGALLHGWLTELLTWFDGERFVAGDYELSAVSETSLQGQVKGERFQLGRHTHGTEVKGVTRHQFRVERAENRWEARIIFDV